MATDFLNQPWLSDAAQTMLRLTFDTATLVLIWLVQLVVYPVFRELTGTDFRRWHPVYTRRVTYVVLPIMLGQAALYAFLLLTAPRADVVVNLLLVVAMWAITFFRAVPLHAALDGPAEHRPLTEQLLRANAYRTAGWTMVWGVTVWRSVGAVVF